MLEGTMLNVRLQHRTHLAVGCHKLGRTQILSCCKESGNGKGEAEVPHMLLIAIHKQLNRLQGENSNQRAIQISNFTQNYVLKALLRPL